VREKVLVLGRHQAANQDAERFSIGTKHMNVTRLMCSRDRQEPATQKAPATSKLNWRFRVPQGETLELADGFFGRTL